MLQGILGNHRTARNRFLRDAPALSPSKKLPNPWQREFKSPHVSSCLKSAEHWYKDGIRQEENKDFTCQSRKSLSRTSPEVRIRRSGSGELLVYRHLSSNDSDTSLRETEASYWDHFPDPTEVALLNQNYEGFGFFLNTGLQIKTGWWSCTTACLQLASDGHCSLFHRLFQTFFQPPKHPLCAFVMEPDCEDFHLEQRAQH